LEPIYTGKLLFGVYDKISKGFFKNGEKVLAIHTGGLQGIKGFNDRFGNLIT
jgi:1-aminocyclopropane-1-carboxylate deaminase